MAMSLKDLIGECGTVRVNTAPLLMLIGAAISTPNGPDVETIVEMLDPQDTP
jgi:hypothetical protein